MVAALRAIFAFVLFALNTAFWGTAVFLMGIVKILWPAGRWRKRCVLIMAGMGEIWVDGNRLIWKMLVPTPLEVRGMPELRRDGKYLVLANHQSWTDILVLFVVFNRRCAFIRFFLKHILLWMPFVGQGCWALEFPFMKRYSREYLERHPEKRHDDFETTRRSCRHYLHIPVTIANFIEGTRFTRDKQNAQGAPFRNLLRPRVGGIAFVLASMGEYLDGIFDVTLAFPGLHHDVTFLDFIMGRVPRIVVVIRELPLAPRFNDRAVISPGPLRDDLKAWVTKIWEEKDALLDDLLSEGINDANPVGAPAHLVDNSRMKSALSVRPIRESDDPALARIIHEVMTEYGSTGPGSSIHDPEISAMSTAYETDRAAYFVVTDGERVLGGGGIGPLAGGDASTCELRKMYFLAEARGKGCGRKIVDLCIRQARAAGYSTVYLETMSSMKEARRLYERVGFRPTDRPLGDTGHFGCDAWMRLEL